MTLSSLVLSTMACATGGSSTEPFVADDDGSSRIHEYNRKWYRDADGDRHGDPDVWIRGRTRPEGYRANATDCDDANADIHPDAEETSNDLDDDCDGFVDNARYSIADVSFTMVGQPRAGGWIGWALGVADLDADGKADIAASCVSCFEKNVYVAYGPTSGRTNARAAVAIGGSNRVNLGDDIAGGDANGDTFADLLVTTYGDADSFDGAYLFLGPIDADRSVEGADAFVAMANRAETRGLIVPDATGDGEADIVVGSISEGPLSYDGTVYVIAGPVTGEVSVADALYTYDPGVQDGAFGYTLEDLGDTNGDGISDLLAAAPYAASPDAGIVYLIEGGGTLGTYAVEDVAFASLVHPTPGANFGEYATVGDLDGDGNPDVITAGEAPDASVDMWATYLHLGPLSGATSIDDADARWSGDGVTYAGMALDSGADLDGDGVADLAISGAIGADQTGVFLQMGPPSGTIDINTLPAIVGDVDDCTGCRVSLVPDWDGDDRAEIAFAAPYYEVPPYSLVGKIHVMRSTDLD